MRTFFAQLLAGCIAASTLAAQAATLTWTGAVGNQWSNPANWNPPAVPSNGDSVSFPSASNSPASFNDIPNLSLASISFDGSGYTLAGNRIVVTSAISASAGVGGNTVAMQVDVQTNSVRISPSGDNFGLRLTGGLAGSGPISIDRSYVLLAGPSSYSGAISMICVHVNACGALHLENVSMPLATVTSMADAPFYLLSGSGVLGAVSNVNVRPGDRCCGTAASPRGFSTGNLSFGGQAYFVGLHGSSPGLEYSQVSVTGSVNLTNAALDVGASISPAPGQVFTIIDNDGSDPVVGRFRRMSEGAPVTRLSGGMELRVSYAGGDGNDVTVTANRMTPRLTNISTRGAVRTGDDVMIGGFIIGGTEPKKVMVRARGPSLTQQGVTGVLADPTLRLYSGQTQLAANDNWQEAANAAEIQASDLAPADPLESAIFTTLAPGPYTAIVSGANATTGIGIVEVFEAGQYEVPLANIATRAQVLTVQEVMIAGFVVEGFQQTVVVRARGPSLSAHGVPGVLANPVLQLFAGQTQIAVNDDWQQASNAAALQTSGFAPSDPNEAAILITLSPGAYTAIVTGAGGGTGVGIVEVFAQ